jgi:hypothetical protein
LDEATYIKIKKEESMTKKENEKKDVEKEGEELWRSANYANALNTLLQNKLEHIRMIQTFAQLRFAKYEALVDAGFTKEQALMIVVQTKVME